MSVAEGSRSVESSGADEIARDILGSFRAVSPIRDDTARAAHALLDRQDGESRVLRQTEDLQDAFRNLAYTEYRRLESDLQRGRETGTIDLEPRGGDDLPSVLRFIYKTLNELLPAVGTKVALCEDALPLLRLSFPLGKNVVNAAMDEHAGPLSFDAQRPVTLTNSTLTAELIPEGESTRLVIGRVGTAVVGEGQAVILGRDLKMSKIFNAQLPEPMSIPVTLPFPRNETTVSRASILIVRSNGRIFVFDRGARASVTAEQGDFRVEYDPTARDAQGNLGQSVLMRRPELPEQHI